MSRGEARPPPRRCRCHVTILARPLLLLAAMEPAVENAGGLDAPAPSLASLPPHLLHRVLSLLDRASLVAAAAACVSLFDAACAVAPAPQCAPGLEAALRDALCRAARLPPGCVALSIRPDSAFQAELPLAGLSVALELVLDAGDARDADASRQRLAMGEPADRWLLGLLASPAAALAAESAAAGRAPCAHDGLGARVAALASRARAAVLCARPEHGVVRLQLRPRWLAAAALRSARDAAAQPVSPLPRAAATWLAEAWDPLYCTPDAPLKGVLAFLLLPHQLADMRHRRGAALDDAALILGAFLKQANRCRNDLTCLCCAEAPTTLRAALAASPRANDDDAGDDVAGDDVDLALRLDAVVCATWRAQAASSGEQLQAALGELAAAARLARDACAAARPRTALGAPATAPLPPPRRALLAAAAAALQRVADAVATPLAATLALPG